MLDLAVYLTYSSWLNGEVVKSKEQFLSRPCLHHPRWWLGPTRARLSRWAGDELTVVGGHSTVWEFTGHHCNIETVKNITRICADRWKLQHAALTSDTQRFYT